jgi:hypothetical protein
VRGLRDAPSATNTTFDVARKGRVANAVGGAQLLVFGGDS